MQKYKDFFLQFLGLPLLFAAIFCIVKLLIHYKVADSLRLAFEANESWGWLFYVFLNAALFCLCIPAAVLGSMAGAVLGMTWGSILYIFSCILSCVFTFYLTRFFLLNKVQKKVENNPKLQALQKAVENEGWLLLFLVRFLPIHATILNLLLAVTTVNLRQFLFSSACMIPEWMAYIYLGAAAAEAQLLNVPVETSIMENTIKIVTFILVITAISYAGKIARRTFTPAGNNASVMPD